MIKPEDIPISLIDKCERLNPALEGDWFDAKAIAAILNAAIEAGVVSPPCRILRDQFGMPDRTYLFIDDNEAQSHASPGGSSEHWKGQTE